MSSSILARPFIVAVVSLFAILFLIPIYITIIRNGHSVSDDLYQMFVYTTCTVFWWKWLTKKPQDQKVIDK